MRKRLARDLAAKIDFTESKRERDEFISLPFICEYQIEPFT